MEDPENLHYTNKSTITNCFMVAISRLILIVYLEVEIVFPSYIVLLISIYSNYTVRFCMNLHLQT